MRWLALALSGLLALPAYADGPRTQSGLALTAPTAVITDNSNRIATTAYVQNVLGGGIPLASGKIFIGSVGNLATPQTMSGDCTISIPGVITCTQAAGSFNVIGNLTVGGSIIDGNGILFTNIAAPATPAAGTTRAYVDSTTKTLTAKNDVGTVSNTVAPSTCSANQFGTSISAAGVFGCTQPAVSNISGFGTGVATALGVNVGTAGAPVTNGGALGTPSSGTGTNLTGIPTTGLTGTLQAAQEPAHTGDCTNTAGSLALTCLKTNGTSFTAGATAAAGQLPGEPGVGVAAAGNVGELISLNVPAGSAISNTTAIAANVASVSLTAGDWDVYANVVFTPAGGTTPTVLGCWVSTASATVPTAPNGGSEFFLQLPFTIGVTQFFPCGKRQITVSSTTTVFLSSFATFTGGTLQSYGFIGARRAR